MTFSRAKMKKWFEKWLVEKAKRREKGLPGVVDYRDVTYVGDYLSCLFWADGNSGRVVIIGFLHFCCTIAFIGVSYINVYCLASLRIATCQWVFVT